MIDFGLKPCPLCGGEAELARLTQSSEHQSGVIKCTDCGLTLEWETDIKVTVSRTGKRTTVKAGPNLIEAWNRRQECTDCENCGYKIHSDMVAALPNCNDCGNLRNCEHEPKVGGYARINCPLWREMEAEA